MKKRIVVVAIIERDGKFLMGNKAKDVGPYPNTWRIPGGGVEEGETLEAAIKREVKEETNLDTVSVEKMGMQEDETENKHGKMTHYIFHLFKVKTRGKETSTEEFPELKWVSQQEFRNLPLAKPSIEFFKQLGYL